MEKLNPDEAPSNNMYAQYGDEEYASEVDYGQEDGGAEYVYGEEGDDYYDEYETMSE